MKKCYKCQTVKDLSEFYVDRSRSDGRRSTCKVCTYLKIGRAHLVKADKLCNRCKERKNKSEFYSQSNICRPCDKLKNKHRKRSSTNPVVNALKNGKRRAAGSLSYTTLTFITSVYRECFRCGSRESLHLDHIRPVALGGHTDLANIQTLCRDCNLSKGATTADYRYTYQGFQSW